MSNFKCTENANRAYEFTFPPFLHVYLFHMTDARIAELIYFYLSSVKWIYPVIVQYQILSVLYFIYKIFISHITSFVCLLVSSDFLYIFRT